SKLTARAKEVMAAFPQIAGQRFAILQGMVGPPAGTGTGVTPGLGDFARVRQNPRFNSSPLMQFADTLSWTRGSHSFQAGFEATYAKSGQYDAINSRPTANLGVGTVPISNITTTNFRGLNTNDITLAQDLLSNLTLNLGVRYDLYGTPYDDTGMGVKPIGGQAALFGSSGMGFGARFTPGAKGGSPTIIGFAGKGSPNPNTLIYNNDFNNVAPS